MWTFTMWTFLSKQKTNSKYIRNTKEIRNPWSLLLDPQNLTQQIWESWMSPWNRRIKIKIKKPKQKVK